MEARIAKSIEKRAWKPKDIPQKAIEIKIGDAGGRRGEILEK